MYRNVVPEYEAHLRRDTEELLDKLLSAMRTTATAGSRSARTNRVASR